jgi:hypothetical protein
MTRARMRCRMPAQHPISKTSSGVIQASCMISVWNSRTTPKPNTQLNPAPHLVNPVAARLVNPFAAYDGQCTSDTGHVTCIYRAVHGPQVSSSNSTCCLPAWKHWNLRTLNSEMAETLHDEPSKHYRYRLFWYPVNALNFILSFLSDLLGEYVFWSSTWKIDGSTAFLLKPNQTKSILVHILLTIHWFENSHPRFFSLFLIFDICIFLFFDHEQNDSFSGLKRGYLVNCLEHMSFSVGNTIEN